MVLVNKSGCWQLGWVSVLVISEATLSGSKNYLLAQIVPDRTLGNESSAIAPNVEVKGLPAQLIEGGAARGSNLFHSFAEFNVGELQRVYFANPAGIENILSRVTGSNVSNILGTLGVDGIANLFFLNPNGIIFGENARLDVAGSFVGSTANSFVFPDGSEFSATNPTAPPLLKINLTPGLQYGQNPRGDLVNSGNLTVTPRQTLSLSGKDVTSTGNLTAPGGTVQLLGERVGLLDNAKIDVSSDSGKGGNITLIGNGDVLLNNGALIDVSGEEGGNIAINARNIKILGRSEVRGGANVSTGLAGGQSGDIVLNATGTIAIEESSQISNDTDSNVNGGDINITARSLSLTGKSQLSANTLGAGDGGSVRIKADTVSFDGVSRFVNPRSGAFSTVGSGAEGNAGGIEITTGSLSLTNGALLSTETWGQGDGGSVRIRADNVFFDRSDAVSRAAPRAVGNAGGIEITTDSLSLTNGAQLDARSLGEGNGGSVRIEADTVSFDGSSALTQVKFPDAEGNAGGIEITTSSLSLTNGAGLSTITRGGGNAGGIEITTDSLSLTDAILTTSTLAQGDAGSIIINANDTVSFDGSLAESKVGRGAEPGAKGNGGNIDIQTRTLSLANGSQILANTFGEGNAGKIKVKASDSVIISGFALGSVSSESGLFANTAAIGAAGNITVNTPELTLQQDAEISTSTTGAGKAGDITLDTPILNLASGGKVLAFTSGSGDGGTITVNAPKQVNLGIGVQDFEPIISVETSDAGKAGDIFLTTPTLTLSDTARITATATATATNTEGGGSISLNASKMDLAGIVGVFAETQGESPAGTLTLKPDNNKPTLDLTLAPGAKISASTSASGNGGDLLVSAPQVINISGQGKLAVETTGTGNAGNIEIDTQKLTLSDRVEISASTSGGAGGTIKVTANTFDATDGAKLLTTTSGESNAGSIILNVSDNITLAGDNTELFANTTSKSTGDGGSIFIDPETIILQDGASIAVNSQGSGEGGNIELQAGSLTLERGVITAETASNQGGNINLQLFDLLTLRNSSQISANAGTAKTPEAEGDGGNINIDSPFILSFPDNNNITAEAFLGTGGNIDITTNSIFGSEFLDISASSQFGLEGTVSINTLELEPSQGLVELPSKLETPQILQGCEASRGGGSSFISTGRGGLPPSPTETLSSRQVWKDVQLPTQLTKNSANTVKHSNTNNERIVEATGWIINEEGILELVAEKSSDTHQGSCR